MLAALIFASKKHISTIPCKENLESNAAHLTLTVTFGPEQVGDLLDGTAWKPQSQSGNSPKSLTPALSAEPAVTQLHTAVPMSEAFPESPFQHRALEAVASIPLL